MIAYIIACMLHFSISATPNIRNSLIKLIEVSRSLQPIGEIIDILHKEGIYESLPLQWPVKGKYRISSHYGYRNHPLTGTKNFTREWILPLSLPLRSMQPVLELSYMPDEKEVMDDAL